MSESYRAPDGTLRRRPPPPSSPVGLSHRDTVQQSQPQSQQPQKPTGRKEGGEGKAAAPPKSHPLAVFIGKRICIQRGPNTYIGLLASITDRWLILKDARVVGTQRTVHVPELWANNEVSQITHVHLEIEPSSKLEGDAS